MSRTRALALGLVLLAAPAGAADLHAPERTGRFRASCEDLGQFCFADACGGNQIEAALRCRAICPNSSILEVVPGICPIAPVEARVRLRARG